MFGLWLFGMFFFGIGVYGSGIASRDMLRGIASRHWATTGGVVISATISESTGSETRTRSTRYGARIVYEYQVANHTYTGTRKTFNDASADLSYAQSILNCYPPGRKVTVHYAPDQPAQAVLTPGIADMIWLPVLGGGIFLATGVMILAMREAVISARG